MTCRAMLLQRDKVIALYQEGLCPHEIVRVTNDLSVDMITRFLRKHGFMKAVDEPVKRRPRNDAVVKTLSEAQEKHYLSVKEQAELQLEFTLRQKRFKNGLKG